MSVADLSPGDKLSLKGKIFELQKKLNLLDVEQQHTEEYSFQPEITQYKLPHRENDFIHNMKKAEDSRKERLESLKEMVVLEIAGEYTYRPSINKMSQARKSTKPVFIRLNEKGKEYQVALEKRINESSNYDRDGRKLFVPQRVVRKPQPSPVESYSEMQVEEYLYRDAQDRAVRRQLFAEEESRGRVKLASERKMNKKSEILVRRKHLEERELRLIFETLVIFSSEQEQTSIEREFSRVNLTGLQQLTEAIQLKFRQKMKESLGISKTLITSLNEPYDLVERVWNILDPDEVGYINVQSFVSVCLPILLSRGGKDNSQILASPNHSTPTFSPLIISDQDFDIGHYSDDLLLHQFLIELRTFILSHQVKTTSPLIRSDPNRQSSFRDSRTRPDRVLDYNEILTQREKVSKDRMEELRHHLYEEKMKECTFNPQITNVATRLHQNPAPGSNSSHRDQTPAYMRLYRQKDKIARVIVEKKHRTHEERELDECTFAPTIYSRFEKPSENIMETHPHPNLVNDEMNSSIDLRENGNNHPLPPKPNGFSETVQRMRNALERRKMKEKEDSDVFAFNEDSYLKKKQLLASEGCKPFRLRTEERQTEKLKALQVTDSSGSQEPSMKGFVRRGNGELKPVRLYVEIKLGGGVKGSHIAVADDDIPVNLAKTFCRIYSLDVGAEAILTEVLTNHMIDNGIPIGTLPSKMTQNELRINQVSEIEFEDRNYNSIDDSDTLIEEEEYSSPF